MILKTFPMSICHLYIFFNEVCLFSSFAYFLIGLLIFLMSFKSPLYILDISLLPNVIYKYFLTVCGFSFS